MFEQKNEKLVPMSAFIRRMVVHIGIVGALVSGALSIGVAGYHWLAGLNWVDSLLNASMILGGMGPVDTLTNVAAKLFASFYALFSGLLFIAGMSIILVPVIHRILHKFHMDENDV